MENTLNGRPLAQSSARHMTYHVEGRGPALLLLHAFPLDRRMWSDTVAALAPTHQVITVDYRGFGQTPLGPEPYSLADLADDAAGLLTQLGVRQATVAGLSMGGYVALAFAARHRERLARLILCDTRAAADSEEARHGRDQGMATLRSTGVEAFVTPLVKRLLAPSCDEAVQRRTLQLALEQRAEGLVAALGALRDRPDRRGELAQIPCPTLVVVGSEDLVTPPAEAQAMAAAIPGAQLVQIPGAGHLPNLEKPEAFHQALRRFLGDR